MDGLKLSFNKTTFQWDANRPLAIISCGISGFMSGEECIPPQTYPPDLPTTLWTYPHLPLHTPLHPSPGHTHPLDNPKKEYGTRDIYPRKDIGPKTPTQHPWTDRHLRKYYLTATSFAGGNNHAKHLSSVSIYQHLFTDHLHQCKTEKATEVKVRNNTLVQPLDVIEILSQTDKD